MSKGDNQFNIGIIIITLMIGFSIFLSIYFSK